MGSVGHLALDRSDPPTLYAATSDGVWAYTFGEAPVEVSTSAPPVDESAPLEETAGGLSLPPFVGLVGTALAVVAIASSLVWIEGRRRR